jgi:hypothetical protein
MESKGIAELALIGDFGAVRYLSGLGTGWGSTLDKTKGQRISIGNIKW